MNDEEPTFLPEETPVQLLSRALWGLGEAEENTKIGDARMTRYVCAVEFEATNGDTWFRLRCGDHEGSPLAMWDIKGFLEEARDMLVTKMHLVNRRDPDEGDN